MTQAEMDIPRDELFNKMSEYIQKLSDQGVINFAFMNSAESVCLRLVEHDKGAFDPLVVAVFDSVETHLKLSVRWMQDRLILGTGIVAYENTMVSKQRARMWALMIHVHNYFPMLMSN